MAAGARGRWWSPGADQAARSVEASRLRRGELLIITVVLVVAALTRLAWRAQTLTTWDSVLFALALDDFDVYRARPHAPGYPVFIAAARLLAGVTPDANAALVALSALFSLGTLVLLYLFVRLSAPAAVAAATALTFSFAPVFVYNSVIASAYTAEAFFSLALAILAWRLIQRPSVVGAAWVGAVFGIGLGVRTSLLFYLAPLLAVAVLWPLRAYIDARRVEVAGASPEAPAMDQQGAGEREDRREVPADAHPLGRAIRQALAAGGAAFVAVMVWLVPMVQSSQGWTRYWAATNYQSEHVVFAEAVWDHGVAALVDHAVRLGSFLRYEARLVVPWAALVAVAVLVALALRWQQQRRTTPGRHGVDDDAVDPAPGAHAPSADPAPVDALPAATRRATGVPAWFYALWILPSILFYLIVFAGWGNGPVGYALVFLPAFYAVGGVAAHRAARALVASARRRRASPHQSERIVWALAALIVLVPGPALAAASHAHVVDQVQSHDDWSASWAALPGTFPPNETAILTTYSWAHVKWYHPEYLTWTPLIVPDVETGGTRWFMLETQDREDDQPLYDPHVRPATVRPHPIPSHIETIVVFDFQIAGENDGPRLLSPQIDVQERSLDNGWRVLYFHPDPERDTMEAHLGLLDDLVGEAPS